MSNKPQMDWSSAFNYLMRGHRIKHPEWGGFWWWDELTDTILMFTKRGAIVDLRKSADFRYTMTFVGQSKWIVADDEDLGEQCLAVWNVFKASDQPNRTVEDIARICHEVNRAYCAAMGDDNQVAWDDAPHWQKDSAMNGVKMHLDNPDATPEDSHVSWYAQKEAEGWVYGEVKDPEAKTHPCMVPYAELPAEQRAKDYLFRATVHNVAGVLRANA